MAGSITFRTTVLLAGRTATGLPVPSDVVERLASGKRPKVRVTIGGHTYRSTVAVYGDEFFLPLNAENRAAAGVSAGDEVKVKVELDTEPRVVTVPPDFAAALKRDAVAGRAFEKLSYSHQREHVLAIEEAKKPETRARRIAKAVEMLRAVGDVEPAGTLGQLPEPLALEAGEDPPSQVLARLRADER